MKLVLFLVLTAYSVMAFSQNLQIHYDFRHTINPGISPQNYPSFSFEYFKNMDTAGTGSFLMKLQADLNGKNSNTGQVYTQLSQSLRFWKPKIYLSMNYSGGLGVNSSSFGYYINSSYGLGISCPFQWHGAWVAASLIVRYTAFDRPSYDPQLTLYFGRGFFNYKLFTSGSFVFWTHNKDLGIEITKDQHGKKFAFFGDPQLWVRIKNNFSAGTRMNVYFHIYPMEYKVQLYPTIGLKYQF